MAGQGRDDTTPPRRSIGRRPLFFAVAALASIVLVPAAPSEFRWVAWFTAALAAFWAVALALEELSRPSGAATRRRAVESGSPFAPPPRPGGSR